MGRAVPPAHLLPDPSYRGWHSSPSPSSQHRWQEGNAKAQRQGGAAQPREAPALAKLPPRRRKQGPSLTVALPLQEPQPTDALVPCILLSW